MELVDSAMVKMRDFPYSPQLYFDIVFKCYLSRFRYTEPELLETLRMERSTYYDRKKEAIKIFGLSFGGVLFLKSNRLWKNRYFMNRGEVVL